MTAQGSTRWWPTDPGSRRARAPLALAIDAAAARSSSDRHLEVLLAAFQDDGDEQFTQRRAFLQGQMSEERALEAIDLCVAAGESRAPLGRELHQPLAPISHIVLAADQPPLGKRRDHLVRRLRRHRQPARQCGRGHPFPVATKDAQDHVLGRRQPDPLQDVIEPLVGGELRLPDQIAQPRLRRHDKVFLRQAPAPPSARAPRTRAGP